MDYRCVEIWRRLAVAQRLLLKIERASSKVGHSGSDYRAIEEDDLGSDDDGDDCERRLPFGLPPSNVAKLVLEWVCRDWVPFVELCEGLVGYSQTADALSGVFLLAIRILEATKSAVEYGVLGTTADESWELPSCTAQTIVSIALQCCAYCSDSERHHHRNKKYDPMYCKITKSGFEASCSVMTDALRILFASGLYTPTLDVIISHVVHFRHVLDDGGVGAQEYGNDDSTHHDQGSSYGQRHEGVSEMDTATARLWILLLNETVKAVRRLGGSPRRCFERICDVVPLRALLKTHVEYHFHREPRKCSAGGGGSDMRGEMCGGKKDVYRWACKCIAASKIAIAVRKAVELVLCLCFLHGEMLQGLRDAFSRHFTAAALPIFTSYSSALDFRAGGRANRDGQRHAESYHAQLITNLGQLVGNDFHTRREINLRNCMALHGLDVILRLYGETVMGRADFNVALSPGAAIFVSSPSFQAQSLSVSSYHFFSASTCAKAEDMTAAAAIFNVQQAISKRRGGTVVEEAMAAKIIFEAFEVLAGNLKTKRNDQEVLPTEMGDSNMHDSPDANMPELFPSATSSVGKDCSPCIMMEAQRMLLRRVKLLEAYHFHDDETKQQLDCLKSTATTVVKQFTSTIPSIESKWLNEKSKRMGAGVSDESGCFQERNKGMQDMLRLCLACIQCLGALLDLTHLSFDHHLNEVMRATLAWLALDKGNRGRKKSPTRADTIHTTLRDEHGGNDLCARFEDGSDIVSGDDFSSDDNDASVPISSLCQSVLTAVASFLCRLVDRYSALRQFPRFLSSLLQVASRGSSSVSLTLASSVTRSSVGTRLLLCSAVRDALVAAMRRCPSGQFGDVMKIFDQIVPPLAATATLRDDAQLEDGGLQKGGHAIAVCRKTQSESNKDANFVLSVARLWLCSWSVDETTAALAAKLCARSARTLLGYSRGISVGGIDRSGCGGGGGDNDESDDDGDGDGGDGSVGGPSNRGSFSSLLMLLNTLPANTDVSSFRESESLDSTIQKISTMLFTRNGKRNADTYKQPNKKSEEVFQEQLLSPLKLRSATMVGLHWYVALLEAAMGYDEWFARKDAHMGPSLTAHDFTTTPAVSAEMAILRRIHKTYNTNDGKNNRCDGGVCIEVAADARVLKALLATLIVALPSSLEWSSLPQYSSCVEGGDVFNGEIKNLVRITTRLCFARIVQIRGMVGAILKHDVLGTKTLAQFEIPHDFKELKEGGEKCLEIEAKSLLDFVFLHRPNKISISHSSIDVGISPVKELHDVGQIQWPEDPYAIFLSVKYLSMWAPFATPTQLQCFLHNLLDEYLGDESVRADEGIRPSMSPVNGRGIMRRLLSTAEFWEVECLQKLLPSAVLTKARHLIEQISERIEMSAQRMAGSVSILPRAVCVLISQSELFLSKFRKGFDSIEGGTHLLAALRNQVDMVLQLTATKDLSASDIRIMAMNTETKPSRCGLESCCEVGGELVVGLVDKLGYLADILRARPFLSGFVDCGTSGAFDCAQGIIASSLAIDAALKCLGLEKVSETKVGRAFDTARLLWRNLVADSCAEMAVALLTGGCLRQESGAWVLFTLQRLEGGQDAVPILASTSSSRKSSIKVDRSRWWAKWLVQTTTAATRVSMATPSLPLICEDGARCLYVLVHSLLRCSDTISEAAVRDIVQVLLQDCTGSVTAATAVKKKRRRNRNNGNANLIVDVDAKQLYGHEWLLLYSPLYCAVIRAIANTLFRSTQFSRTKKFPVGMFDRHVNSADSDSYHEDGSVAKSSNVTQQLGQHMQVSCSTDFLIGAAMELASVSTLAGRSLNYSVYFEVKESGTISGTHPSLKSSLFILRAELYSKLLGVCNSMMAVTMDGSVFFLSPPWPTVFACIVSACTATLSVSDFSSPPPSPLPLPAARKSPGIAEMFKDAARALTLSPIVSESLRIQGSNTSVVYLALATSESFVGNSSHLIASSQHSSKSQINREDNCIKSEFKRDSNSKLNTFVLDLVLEMLRNAGASLSWSLSGASGVSAAFQVVIRRGLSQNERSGFIRRLSSSFMNCYRLRRFVTPFCFSAKVVRSSVVDGMLAEDQRVVDSLACLRVLLHVLEACTGCDQLVEVSDSIELSNQDDGICAGARCTMMASAVSLAALSADEFTPGRATIVRLLGQLCIATSAYAEQTAVPFYSCVGEVCNKCDNRCECKGSAGGDDNGGRHGGGNAGNSENTCTPAVPGALGAPYCRPCSILRHLPLLVHPLKQPTPAQFQRWHWHRVLLYIQGTGLAMESLRRFLSVRRLVALRTGTVVAAISAATVVARSIAGVAQYIIYLGSTIAVALGTDADASLGILRAIHFVSAAVAWAWERSSLMVCKLVRSHSNLIHAGGPLLAALHLTGFSAASHLVRLAVTLPRAYVDARATGQQLQQLGEIGSKVQAVLAALAVQTARSTSRLLCDTLLQDTPTGRVNGSYQGRGTCGTDDGRGGHNVFWNYLSIPLLLIHVQNLSDAGSAWDSRSNPVARKVLEELQSPGLEALLAVLDRRGLQEIADLVPGGSQGAPRTLLRLVYTGYIKNKKSHW